MSGQTTAMPMLSSKPTLTPRPPSTTLLPSFSSSLTVVSHSLAPRRSSSVTKKNSFESSLRPSPSDSLISASCSAVDVNEPLIPDASSEENDAVQAKVGAKVRVKVPLKVYHVPRVPELDLTGMEGQLKQYVSLWKGKVISANLPYKVEFITQVEGRGPVKFSAHLKEGEFEYV